MNNDRHGTARAIQRFPSLGLGVFGVAIRAGNILADFSIDQLLNLRITIASKIAGAISIAVAYLQVGY